MSELNVNEIFNSFTEKEVIVDTNKNQVELKDRPNPLLKLTDETLCVLRSYLTVLISDYDMESNQSHFSENDERTDLFRKTLSDMIKDVDVELTRRNIKDEWMKY